MKESPIKHISQITFFNENIEFYIRKQKKNDFFPQAHLAKKKLCPSAGILEQGV